MKIRQRLSRVPVWAYALALATAAFVLTHWLTSGDVRFREYASASVWPSMTTWLSENPFAMLLANLTAFGLATTAVISRKTPRLGKLSARVAVALAVTTAMLLLIMFGIPSVRWHIRQAKADALDEPRDAKNSWAGQYYAGDGLGFNATVYLLPDGKFLSRRDGCLGHYSSIFGEQRPSHSGVELIKDASVARGQPEPNEFIKVKWGARRYLVAAGSRTQFCDSWTEGLEPRSSAQGATLMHRGDWESPASGIPKDISGKPLCPGLQ